MPWSKKSVTLENKVKWIIQSFNVTEWYTEGINRGKAQSLLSSTFLHYGIVGPGSKSEKVILLTAELTSTSCTFTGENSHT